MSDASNEVSNSLLVEILREYAESNKYSSDPIFILIADAAERLRDQDKALNEIIEIYAGMDGFIPETASEGYQQRIIKQMYQAAIKKDR